MAGLKYIVRNLISHLAPFPNGLGVADLPIEIYKGKQHIHSTDFKKMVDLHLSPKILGLGFQGKGFYYLRKKTKYTEVVTFWPYKLGGAIAVTLSVKFHDINYTEKTLEKKSESLKLENCEFNYRLSPNNQAIWFWVYKPDLEANISILDDIWRVFETRGLDYFKGFEEPQKYIGKITPKKCLEFKDFDFMRLFGKGECAIVFFLFSYWLNENDKVMAMSFAKFGISKFSEMDCPDYVATFKSFMLNNLVN